MIEIIQYASAQGCLDWSTKLIEATIAPMGNGVISESFGRVAIPGQEFINSIGGMIGNMREHVTQPCFWIDTVQFGSADQRIDRGCPIIRSANNRANE